MYFSATKKVCDIEISLTPAEQEIVENFKTLAGRIVEEASNAGFDVDMLREDIEDNDTFWDEKSETLFFKMRDCLNIFDQ